LPVERYVHPDTFAMFEREAAAMGFGMPPSVRWCDPRTMRTGRRIMPA